MSTRSQLKTVKRPAVLKSRRTRAVQRASASRSVLHLCRILVPMDFSPCSERALQYALALGQRFKASVTLLHVAEIGSPGYEFGSTDFPRMEAAIRQHALTELTRLTGEQRRASVPIEVRVRSAWPFAGGKRPYAEIIQAAQDWATDLIVLGTHGHTGLDHVLLGSTAERVVRHAPCPVLVVRECALKTVPPILRAERSDPL